MAGINNFLIILTAISSEQKTWYPVALWILCMYLCVLSWHYRENTHPGAQCSKTFCVVIIDGIVAKLMLKLLLQDWFRDKT